jgi:integrase
MTSQEFRLLQQIYVLADDREHGAAKRQPPRLKEEADRDRWLRKIRKEFEPLFKEDGPAMILRREAEERFPDDPKKALSWWKKKAQEVPEIANFIGRVNLLKKSPASTLSKLSAVAFGEMSRRKGWEGLQASLMKVYREYRIQKAREPLLRGGLPEAFIAGLMPPAISVDVSPDGELVNEFQLFGTRERTLEAKRKSLVVLLKNWNKLTKQVNEDLNSSDPTLRLKALIISILMSTGIRVGAGQSQKKDPETHKPIKDEDGNPIMMDTFGATSLLPEHVEFVRDNFARLDFPGKHGTRNVVSLTDPQIVAALQEQILAASAQRNPKYIFVTPGGARITKDMVRNYMKKIVGQDVYPHNFRHLKSAETLYEVLRREQANLAEKMKAVKAETKPKMIEKVLDVISSHLNEAIEETQKTLHHESPKTTVESYIPARLILAYLTKNGFIDALDTVLGDSHGIRIRFDVEDFYEFVVGSPMTTAKSKSSGTMFYYGNRFVDYDIDDTIEKLEEESSES